MINFTVGHNCHIVELQIVHARMLTARKGVVVVVVGGVVCMCV